jgi:hypothetical protein
LPKEVEEVGEGRTDKDVEDEEGGIEEAEVIQGEDIEGVDEEEDRTEGSIVTMEEAFSGRALKARQKESYSCLT